MNTTAIIHKVPLVMSGVPVAFNMVATKFGGRIEEYLYGGSVA